MKKLYPIAICILLSLGAVLLSGSTLGEDINAVNLNNTIEDSRLKQEIASYSEDPVLLYKLYEGHELIGYIQDTNKIDELLDDTYSSKYEDKFPGTEMALGEDLFITEEMSYFIPEYDDTKILEYINDNDLYSVVTNRVDFSNSDGVYASIFVADMDLFDEAQREFLRLFVSDEALNAFANKNQLPELQEYGRRELSATMVEKITATTALASPSKIMTTKEEMFDYLGYGDLVNKEYYTVVEGDTVRGIGGGRIEGMTLSAEQMVALNPGVLQSVDQVLIPGTELNITYFQPVVNVRVMQERITKEVVYPGPTEYRSNPDEREGIDVTIVDYLEGSQNSKYEETWINGVLREHDLISSDLVSRPQEEVILRGLKIIPGIGSGTLRWPVDNPSITCGWYCYSNHTALDMVNPYNKGGNVYAADRGKIEVNGYTALKGNYIVINHGNGMKTEYNHFSSPGLFPVGVNVEKGEVIGSIGATGLTYGGAHLHFVVVMNGSRVDPCSAELLAC